MRVERLLGVIAILALGCGKSAPPPQKDTPAPPPVADVDAATKPGSDDQSPIAPATPASDAPKTPLKPLPTGPGPDT